MFGEYDGFVVGLLKRRIERYKEIVEKLFENKKLDEKEKEFLRKEGFEI